MTSLPDTRDPAGVVRNVTLADLALLLRDQQARQVDVVAPGSAIRAVGGRLVIDGTDPEVDDAGVTMTAGTYVPTEVRSGGGGQARHPGWVPAAHPTGAAWAV